MCPIACLPNPFRTHYTHISHRNLLKAEANMCAHTRTGMRAPAGFLYGTARSPCTSFVCYSLIDKRSKKLISFSFSLSQTHDGGGPRPVCISADETEKVRQPC